MSFCEEYSSNQKFHSCVASFKKIKSPLDLSSLSQKFSHIMPRPNASTSQSSLRSSKRRKTKLKTVLLNSKTVNQEKCNIDLHYSTPF